MSKYLDEINKLVKKRKRKDQQEGYKKKIQDEAKERQKIKGNVQTIQDS